VNLNAQAAEAKTSAAAPTVKKMSDLRFIEETPLGSRGSF
jgi:hypothetical protein